MKHNQYRMQWRLKSVKEQWYKPECVALCKHYTKNVHGITLWSFNGSAKKCTYKTGWTFDTKLWDRYTPGPGVPILQGDIIILDIGNDWHVCVGHNQVSDGYYVIEQNRNNTKTWTGQDSIMIWFYDYSTPIINIYRKRW